MKRINFVVGMLAFAALACNLPGQSSGDPIASEDSAASATQAENSNEDDGLALTQAALEATNAAIFSSLTAEAQANEGAAAPAVVILSEILNDVDTRASGTSDWETATNVQLVGDGGGVRTLADSHARLDFPNGNVLWVGQNTIFELSNFVESSWVVRLEQGRVLLNASDGDLGGTVIETPVGIGWVTGSLSGIRYDSPSVAGFTMGIECSEGPCGVAKPPKPIESNGYLLWGDYQYLSLNLSDFIPGGSISTTTEGFALVHLESGQQTGIQDHQEPETPKPIDDQAYKEFGICTENCGRSDQREPLATTWGARYAGSFGTIFAVWRDGNPPDSGDTGTAPTATATSTQTVTPSATSGGAAAPAAPVVGGCFGSPLPDHRGVVGTYTSIDTNVTPPEAVTLKWDLATSGGDFIFSLELWEFATGASQPVKHSIVQGVKKHPGSQLFIPTADTTYRLDAYFNDTQENATSKQCSITVTVGGSESSDTPTPSPTGPTPTGGSVACNPGEFTGCGGNPPFVTCGKEEVGSCQADGTWTCLLDTANCVATATNTPEPTATDAMPTATDVMPSATP